MFLSRTVAACIFIAFVPREEVIYFVQSNVNKINLIFFPESNLLLFSDQALQSHKKKINCNELSQHGGKSCEL